jgi:hypothetical protein
LFDKFPIQSGLKQGEALSPLLFDFALEYATRKVHENQVGLRLNGTHQLLVYADDMNLLRDNINTAKKNKETLFDSSNGVGLQVNAEKTKCMLLSRHKNHIIISRQLTDPMKCSRIQIFANDSNK